jgi:aryl-alcohol dehydrogenase-like predicted oxidoreductase
LVDSLWTSRTEHQAGFVALQMQYSLVTRELEREHIPACQKFGLGVLPWSPLAGGFLSGKYDKSQPPPEGTRLGKWKDRMQSFDNPRNWRILDAVRAVAEERGTTPTAVSLAWVVQKPGVTSAIFGARSVEQLEQCAAAGELQLSAEEMRRLDEASAFELGYPYDFMGRIQGRW